MVAEILTGLSKNRLFVVTAVLIGVVFSFRIPWWTLILPNSYEKKAKSTAKPGGEIINNSKIRVAGFSSPCLIGPRWRRLWRDA